MPDGTCREESESDSAQADIARRDLRTAGRDAYKEVEMFGGEGRKPNLGFNSVGFRVVRVK